MQKVVDIVFVKVVWKMSNKERACFEDSWEHSKRMLEVGLDTAHRELETKIKEHLKEGWVLKGDVEHRRFFQKIRGWLSSSDDGEVWDSTGGGKSD